MTTHGLSHTPEYVTWLTMKARCLNPANEDFDNYGARGIRVCVEWLFDFPAFLSHIGPRPSHHHSIDRIDSNGHYEPGNVRWATPVEQGNNTRRNHRITFNGDTDTLAGWSKRSGLKYSTLKQRINAYGWSVEKALNTPTL